MKLSRGISILEPALGSRVGKLSGKLLLLRRRKGARSVGGKDVQRRWSSRSGVMYVGFYIRNSEADDPGV
jgi:hypothetical protein